MFKVLLGGHRGVFFLKSIRVRGESPESYKMANGSSGPYAPVFETEPLIVEMGQNEASEHRISKAR